MKARGGDERAATAVQGSKIRKDHLYGKWQLRLQGTPNINETTGSNLCSNTAIKGTGHRASIFLVEALDALPNWGGVLVDGSAVNGNSEPASDIRLHCHRRAKL